MKNTKKKQKNQKKNARTIKKRSKNNRKGGGTTETTQINTLNTEIDSSKSDLETKSLEELAKIKEERERANNAVIEDASTIAKGVVANTLESAGDLVGIDIDNPEAVNQKLADIKETLTDPKNTEELKEIVSEVAKKGAVVVEAASPLIDPLAEKALDVGSKTAVKMADTGSTIFFNFIKEIPGVGLAYSLIQDASKIGEAGSAVVNATSELTRDTADSAVVFKRNLEELQKEGMDAQNRATQSVKQFETPFQPDLQIPTTEVAQGVAPAVRGGKRATTKKKGFKKKNTKRVRFAF
jgi:hypothetical protein